MDAAPPLGGARKNPEKKPKFQNGRSALAHCQTKPRSAVGNDSRLTCGVLARLKSTAVA